MTKRSISAITLAALMSAGIAFAAPEGASHQDNQRKEHRSSGKHHAHGHQHKDKDMMPRAFKQLNLTDAQKAQIKAIIEANRPTQPVNHEQQRAQFLQKMMQRQAQEQALISSKNFDEQAARSLIAERQQEFAEMQRQHSERELQHLKTRHALFQVLTPAQQKQYWENQKQQQERRAQRMGKQEHKQPVPAAPR